MRNKLIPLSVKLKDMIKIILELTRIIMSVSRKAIFS